MKKLIWLTTSTILFLVFIAPGLLVLAIDFVPANDQPGYSTDEKRSIYGKRTVSQTFTSQENNLTAIGISLGNPNLKNKKEIILSLYEAGDKEIRSSVLNGLNLEDGDFVKFVFPLIPDSKGKLYRFTVESPGAGPEEVIYVFHTKSVPEWIGELKFDSDEIEGGLPFVTFHKPESKWEVVREIYLAKFRLLDFQKSL